MSTSKRAYEGPDPAQLLLQVWNNHGTEARISEPERVRKGGVMGFFATSVYRIEVEEEPSVPEVVSAKTASNAVTPPTTARPLATAAVADHRSTMSSGLAGLLDQAEDTFELSTMPTRTFDEVLEDVAGSLGTEPKAFTPPPFSPPSPTDGASYGSLPIESFDSIEDLVRRDPLPIESFDSIDDLVRRAIGKTVEEDTSLGLMVPDALLGAAGLVPPPEVGTPAEGHAIDLPSEAPTTTDECVVPDSLAELPFAGPSRDAQGAITDLLAAIGFPTEILQPLTRTPLYPTCVEDAFALLGPSPTVPKTPGALLAIVGAPGEVLTLARAIASAHRINPADVALIADPKSSSRSLSNSPPSEQSPTRSDGGTRPVDGFFATDVATIRALSPGWRRDRVGIVAVELDGHTGRFVRSALRALAPSSVWITADARMKNEDLLRRAETIGGADGLMLEHLDETTTPASVLHAGIPVATIDGRRADITRWIRVVRRVTGEL